MWFEWTRAYNAESSLSIPVAQYGLRKRQRRAKLPGMAAENTHDPVITLLSGLDDLLDITDANIARARLIKQRIAHLRREVTAGKPLTTIVAAEQRPLSLELITDNITALQDVGSRLRWAEAAALRAEGLTVAAIARVFGVTRQRVSKLLQQPPQLFFSLINDSPL